MTNANMVATKEKMIRRQSQSNQSFSSNASSHSHSSAGGGGKAKPFRRLNQSRSSSRHESAPALDPHQARAPYYTAQGRRSSSTIIAKRNNAEWGEFTLAGPLSKFLMDAAHGAKNPIEGDGKKNNASLAAMPYSSEATLNFANTPHIMAPPSRGVNFCAAANKIIEYDMTSQAHGKHFKKIAELRADIPPSRYGRLLSEVGSGLA